MFILVFVLAWVGVVAQSYAVCSSDLSTQAVIEQQGNAEMMGMTDCPSKQSSKPIKMETAQCALYCYGLTTSAVFEPLRLFIHASYIAEAPTVMAHQPTLDHILGVPTPPPNFA